MFISKKKNLILDKVQYIQVELTALADLNWEVGFTIVYSLFFDKPDNRAGVR